MFASTPRSRGDPLSFAAKAAATSSHNDRTQRAKLAAEDFLLSHQIELEESATVRIIAPGFFRWVRDSRKLSPEQWRHAWSPPPKDAAESDGKSGASFVTSHDSTFLLKSLNADEAKVMRDLLPPLYHHLLASPDSLINRPLLLLHVEYGSKQKWYCAFEHLLPARLKLTEIFDLKGSTQGRAAKDSHRRRSPPLLKDLDWLQAGRSLELHAPEDSKRLSDQLERDCAFLQQRDLMDYSLLVGLCENSTAMAAGWQGAGERRYILGLIDYLQRYNRQKRFAHAAKSLTADASTLSTVPPSDYADRMLKFVADSVLRAALAPVQQPVPDTSREAAASPPAVSRPARAPAARTSSPAGSPKQRLSPQQRPPPQQPHSPQQRHSPKQRPAAPQRASPQHAPAPQHTPVVREVRPSGGRGPPRDPVRRELSLQPRNSTGSTGGGLRARPAPRHPPMQPPPRHPVTYRGGVPVRTGGSSTAARAPQSNQGTPASQAGPSGAPSPISRPRGSAVLQPAPQQHRPRPAPELRPSATRRGAPRT
eukprot:TRINITY_DN21176_c0_g1_i1.p1 TRINITY_DN21176_c0_g1~~TRINITY_DN21176_c0_g1_i1.p1  ORF type:complete len:536 (+),score=103.43 TRINITY_DN21176_c0_g1_i1:86-1693(+)